MPPANRCSEPPLRWHNLQHIAGLQAQSKTRKSSALNFLDPNRNLRRAQRRANRIGSAQVLPIDHGAKSQILPRLKNKFGGQSRWYLKTKLDRAGGIGAHSADCQIMKSQFGHRSLSSNTFEIIEGLITSVAPILSLAGCGAKFRKFGRLR